MLSAGLSLGRLVRGIGKVKDRPIMSPTPITLIFMKGRSMGLSRLVVLTVRSELHRQRSLHLDGPVPQ